MTKQYLLIVNDCGMEKLKQVLSPTVEFLEVQGMNMGTDNKYTVLVAPIQPPVNPMPLVIESTQPPTPDVING
jgi:hypothetical protein